MSDRSDRPRRLELLEFRPLRRNTLRGFAAVLLPIGLELRDVVIGESNGRAWATPASKAMLDRDGVALRDEGGKIRYQPCATWRGRELADRFSAAVVALVREQYPDAFDVPEFPLAEPDPPP